MMFSSWCAMLLMMMVHMMMMTTTFMGTHNVLLPSLSLSGPTCLQVVNAQEDQQQHDTMMTMTMMNRTSLGGNDTFMEEEVDDDDDEPPFLAFNYSYKATAPTSNEENDDARFPRLAGAVERLQGALRNLWTNEEEDNKTASDVTPVVTREYPTYAISDEARMEIIQQQEIWREQQQQQQQQQPSYYDDDVTSQQSTTSSGASAYANDDPTAATRMMSERVRALVSSAREGAGDVIEFVGNATTGESAVKSSDPTAQRPLSARASALASRLGEGASNALGRASDVASSTTDRVKQAFQGDTSADPTAQRPISARASALASSARDGASEAASSARDRLEQAFRSITSDGVAGKNDTIRAKAVDAVASAAETVREGFSAVTSALRLGTMEEDPELAAAAGNWSAMMREYAEYSTGPTVNAKSLRSSSPSSSASQQTHIKQVCVLLQDGGERCDLPKTVPNGGQCTRYVAQGDASKPIVIRSKSAPFHVRAAELSISPASAAYSGGVWLEAPSSMLPTTTAPNYQVVMLDGDRSATEVVVRSQRPGGGPPLASQGPGAAALRSLLEETAQTWRLSQGMWTLRLGDTSAGQVNVVLRLCGYVD
uniref:Uncharacterized protein n=1 Tax=Pycnococcus provasolii TaxID=41880 RepID=A0A7S2YW45_9CHLO|mmetsp:Transcript_2073/g.5016  ORF Transcript_2073/g.5016 Transcript_2073/m.5016 type:complete len:599 (+) Transcript_2073:101-1897(+)